MNRLRFLLLAGVCLIAPALPVRAAPVQGGGRSGLEQVPASAPVVIHIRGVQGLQDRLAALMKQALPDVWEKYKEQIDDFFKKGPDDVLKNRKLSGLAKDGPIFVTLLELPKSGDSEPKMAIILTVSSYKEFRDNLLTEEERKNIKDEGNGIESVNVGKSGKTTYFVDRKGYAIATPDKDVAESFTNSKKITGLHTKMNKELAAKLLASDLGVYVNMTEVNKEYEQVIAQAKQGIEQLLAFAAGADESQRKFTEMVKKALPHIFQTIEDLQSLLLSFELRPGGLGLNLQGEVKEGSETAGLLQDARPVDFEELGRLPRGRAFYFATKGSALYKGLASLIPNLVTGAVPKEFEEYIKDLAKAGPNVLLGSGSFPPAGLDVSYFDDPAKVVAATLKMYSDMDAEANKLKEKPVVKKDAEKFGKFTLHSVQQKMDFDKMAEDIKGGEDAKKQFIETMKRLLGETRTIWFGTDGKTVVQVTGPDWKTASKLLEQYSKEAGTVREVKAFTDVRKEMPKQTSLLVLVDAMPMLGRFLEAFKPLIPAGQVPPNWPKMPAKGTSAYAGLALTLQPQRGGLDLFITVAAVQEFYKAVVQPLVGE